MERHIIQPHFRARLDSDALLDCECAPGCPHSLATFKLHAMDPRDAILSASVSAPDSPIVKAVADAVLYDPRYRRSGAGRMFLKHLLVGETQPQADRPHWEWALIGIKNVLTRTGTSDDPRDLAISRELCDAYPNIVDVLYQGVRFIVAAGEVCDARRCFVLTSLLPFHKGRGERGTMDDDHALRSKWVMLQSWLHMSAHATHRHQAVEALATIISYEALIDPVGYMDRVFEKVKQKPFVSRVNALLKDKTFLDLSLSSELSVLCRFAGNAGFRRLFTKARTHRYAAAALRRQLTLGRQKDKTDQVLSQGYIFMKLVIEGGENRVAKYTEALADTCVLQVAALCLRRMAKAPPERHLDGGDWYQFFKQIEHILECEDPACLYHPTPPFFKAARLSLEPIALTTLLALGDPAINTEGSNAARYCAGWLRLMNLLGITERTVRERYKLDNQCCSLACPARNSGRKSPSKAVCSLCRTVFYCDEECQKSDWKAHKRECEEAMEAEFRGVPVNV